MTAPDTHDKELAMWITQYQTPTAVSPLLVNIVKEDRRAIRRRLLKLAVLCVLMVTLIVRAANRHDLGGVAFLSVMGVAYFGFAASVWHAYKPTLRSVCQSTRDYLGAAKLQWQSVAKIERLRRPFIVALGAVGAAYLGYVDVHAPGGPMMNTLFPCFALAVFIPWVWRNSVRSEDRANEMIKSYDETLRQTEDC
jgi:hypothetical protein